jgi:GNAT superfamily N-acetyltransferase
VQYSSAMLRTGIEARFLAHHPDELYRPTPCCGQPGLFGHAGVVAISRELRLHNQLRGSGEICREILAALPASFGIPSSVEDFIAVADRSPTVIASLGDRDIGLLTLVRHSPYSAEVYVMGVIPEFHRQGVGHALLGHAEGILAADGVEFLQVKTLSPSKPDGGYDKTRAFYLACGFRPLEEFPRLWDRDNPALQMIKVVPPVVP